MSIADRRAQHRIRHVVAADQMPGLAGLDCQRNGTTAMAPGAEPLGIGERASRRSAAERMARRHDNVEAVECRSGIGSERRPNNAGAAIARLTANPNRAIERNRQIRADD